MDIDVLELVIVKLDFKIKDSFKSKWKDILKFKVKKNNKSLFKL